MVTAALIVLVGLIRPAWAPRLALICLVLAATFITGSWLRSVLARTEAETRSVETESKLDSSARDARTAPAASADDADADIDADDIDADSDTGSSDTRSPETPLAVAELRDLRAPVGLSQRGMQYLRFVASEQLWSRYRLNLVHQPHWPEIQARVSPELWQAINYQLPPTGGYRPHDQLNRLLTEIERI